MTSFEELARNNLENLSASDLFQRSTEELNNLNKTLELLTLDEEDVRYDVFTKIYGMLHDNIDLRLKSNKLSMRLLALSNLKVYEITENLKSIAVAQKNEAKENEDSISKTFAEELTNRQKVAT